MLSLVVHNVTTWLYRVKKKNPRSGTWVIRTFTNFDIKVLMMTLKSTSSLYRSVLEKYPFEAKLQTAIPSLFTVSAHLGIF
jgi:hypothetical protein